MQGYELSIDNEYSTCATNNENPIYGSHHDESVCKSKCDENENCQFYFINTDGYCALYKSCSGKRTTVFPGSTFKKIEDVNSRNYFHTLYFQSK